MLLAAVFASYCLQVNDVGASGSITIGTICESFSQRLGQLPGSNTYSCG